MRRQLSEHLLLANGADDLIYDLTALEDEHGRHGADAVGHRRFRVLIDIDFADDGTALIFIRKFFDDRRDHAAGATPGRREIDEGWLITLEHVALEGGVGKMKRCFGHGGGHSVS